MNASETSSASTRAGDPSSEASTHHRSRSVPTELGRLGIPIFLALVIVVFSVAKPDTYGTWSNIKAILDNQASVVILALAAMVPLVVGEFDLSVASVLAFSEVLTLGFHSNQGLDPILAIVLTIGVGGAIGLFNGLIVVKLRVNAFVATLGTSTVLIGVWQWYLGPQQTIITPQPKSLTNLARANVPGLGLPLPIGYAATVAIALWLVLNMLPIGRRMYAVGGNRSAAALAGIQTDRVVIGCFICSATLSSVAGVILAANLGTAQGGAGTELLLPAFAGAFLGATTVRPGRFNVIGVVVAVYALAFMISGLEQFGAQVWVTPLFNGGTLIVAVALSGWAYRLRAARTRREQLRRIQAERLT